MPDQAPFPAAFAFSQTSLQDFSDCPRRFQLRYLDHLAWPAVESEPVMENERRLQAGQWFHRLVQQHRLGLPVDTLERLADSPDLKRWWANYQAHPVHLGASMEYTELTFTAPLERHRLVAKYDLVAIRPGEKAVIYDWKTYQKRPRDERMAARWQTRLYRALLVQAGTALNGGQPWQPEQIEMVYWYADYPADPAHFPYTADQYRRDWVLLEQVITEITRAVAYDMTEELERCSACPYRSYCERGVSAGEQGELESELDGSEFNYEQVQEIPF